MAFRMKFGVGCSVPSHQEYFECSAAEYLDILNNMNVARLRPLARRLVAPSPVASPPWVAR